MEYLKFSSSSEGSVAGDVPQCELAATVNPRGPRGAYNVKPFEFPDFVPEVELNLTSRAKWTDILSAVGTGHGYVINESVKELLKTCSLPPHAFYPIRIHSDQETRDYYWFHFITSNFWDWVDRDKSVLSLRSILPNKRSEVIKEADLSVAQQVLESELNSKPRLTDYYWDRLVLNSEFPNYDLFEEPTLFQTLISDRLFSVLETNKIVGFETNPFPLQLKGPDFED